MLGTTDNRLTIWAVGTTRNEADVIGINVHHHLSEGIDHFLILDNGSTDGTVAVLSRLATEVSLEWRARPGRFRQKDLLTNLVREAFIRGADWVLPVDADEFWYAPGSSIRSVLSETAAGALEVQIVNFVQRRRQLMPAPDALLTMTRRPPAAVGPIDRIAELVESRQVAFVEHLYPAKWIARTSPTLEIGWGNHYLFGAREPLQPTDRIVCLHAPLRSRAVLEQKVDAVRPAEDLDDYLREAWHIRRWRRLAAEGLLDREWNANSYAEDSLDLYGEPRPLVLDTRLRDLVAPWIVASVDSDVERSEEEFADVPSGSSSTCTSNTDPTLDASATIETQRRMDIIDGLTIELDCHRAETAKRRREVDVHGRMLAAGQQEMASLRERLEKLERELATASEQLQAARKAYETSRQALDERDRSLSAAETQLSSLKIQLANAQAQLETSCERLQHSESMEVALRHSMSWRLTAPLRVLWDVVLRVRRTATTTGAVPSTTAALVTLDPIHDALRVTDAPVAVTGSASGATATVDARVLTAAVAPTTPRFLVLAEMVPTPDLDSGSYRLNLMLKLLVEQGYSTTILCHNEEAQRRYVDAIRRLGAEIHCGAGAVLDYLRREGHTFHYVLLTRPEMAFRYLFAVRAAAVHATIVYDTVDLHSVRMQRHAELSGDAEVAREAERYARIEAFSAASSDLVIAVTETERRTLLDLDPSLCVEVIPNIHPTVGRAGGWETRRDLFFIGGFWHRPNEDAVRFFVADILPLVQQVLPDVVFTIVGSNMPDTVKALASSSVQCVGYVADPEPYFDRSRVFVSPLRYGAGMKGKIGHSMSHGLPVVTTSLGAEGMELVDGETALIADSPESFARAVVRLYTDERRWTRMSDASVAHIREHFSEDAARRRLQHIFAMPSSVAAACEQTNGPCRCNRA